MRPCYAEKDVMAMEPRLETLIGLLRHRESPANLALVRRAYQFAERAHKGQTRITGEPYLNHPLATAVRLAEMKLGISVVLAGLLHDVLEDTTLPPEEVRQELHKEFGDDVLGLVERVTKLGKVQYRGIDRYVENLRRMFLAMAQDVRAIFIKFADRVHNLETLDVVPETKRRRIALESLDIYAPIANRLGMGEIRGLLEDHSFKHAYPKEYAWVTGLLKERLPKKTQYLERIRKLTRQDLTMAGIKILEIHGRTKHLYSLYKKLLTHDKDIDKIHDLAALRIVVPTVGDCYAAMGIIHQRWHPLKGRIKDYIAQPKPNGYQSLHTTVFCEDGEIVEIQIRTPEMHEEAEYGIAAHWQYDEGGKRASLAKEKLAWVKELAKIQREIQDSRQFLRRLEDMKIDVFHNHIFVFTPNGDVIDLPEDATPVDFAYAIHTEVGNHCSGARINEVMSALGTPLKSGDMVEIILDKNRKGPSPDWLKFVKTGNARDKIKVHSKQKLADWLKQVLPPVRKKG